MTKLNSSYKMRKETKSMLVGLASANDRSDFKNMVIKAEIESNDTKQRLRFKKNEKDDSEA